MPRRTVLRALAQLFVSLCLPCVGPSVLRAEPLRVDRTAEAMRVDGALREWRGATFAELGEPGRHVRYALASSDDGLYLGADVDDDVAVRSGSARDALVLVLDDGGDRPRRREVWLYPGELGRSKASSLVGAPGALKADARVRVVEGPRSSGSGYVLEAFIPFESLFGRALWEASRAALRLEDADGKGALARVDSARGGALPRFALGQGEADFFASFASARGKPGIEPVRELRANLIGDARPERAALIDTALVVYGPSVQDGKAFVYFELPVSSAAAVEELATVDFDGDGASEIVVRYRQKNAQGARSVYAVLSVGDAQIRRVFAAEIKKEVGAESVAAGLELVSLGRGTKRLRLFALPEGKTKASTFIEQPAADMVPLPVPWGPVRSRTYQFEGGHFSELSELARVEPEAPPAAAVMAPSPSPRAVSMREEPASPEALLAHARRAAGLPDGLAPRAELRANLTGGPRPERCYVLGNLLVALGPDVGEGHAYAAYGLSVPEGAVGKLELADVTGDGLAEALVRLRQPLSGAAGVERELLLVLGLDGARFERLAAIEVARRQGARAIVNGVQSSGGALVVDAGELRGWDAASYPFADDAGPGIEPLLLPWKSRARRFTVRDGKLAPVP